MIKRLFQVLFIVLVGLAAYYGFVYQKNHPVQSAKAAGVTYYVATTGSDTTGNGSSASPWKTIQKAADNAVHPGDTVIVRDGTYTYTGPVGGNFVTLRYSGAAGSPITFKAEHKGMAVLDGGGTYGPGPPGPPPVWDLAYCFVWGKALSYIVIQDFDIRNWSRPSVLCGPSGEGSSYTTIRGNHFHHSKAAIYTRTGSSHWTIDGNIFNDIGTIDGDNPGGNHDHGVYACSTNDTYTNNVFYDMRGGWGIQIAAYGAVTGIVISNNTFLYGDTRGQVIIWRGADGAPISDITCQNNIFYRPLTGKVAVGFAFGYTGPFSSFVLRNNLTYAGTLWDGVQSGVTESNNLTGDPLFSSPSTQDFHLRDRSPAINAGIADRAPTIDYDGKNRVGLPDIGAFEYITSILEPTITKSVDKSSATSGQILTYTLTYKGGTLAVTNAKIEDTTPANTTYVPGGTYSAGKVTWNIGNLAANAPPVSVTFQVRVN